MFEEPERLRTNEFWGRRAGAKIIVDNKLVRVFKIKRGGGVNTGNSGPAGHKLRWYQDRAWRKLGGKNWAKKRYQALKAQKVAA